MKTAILSTLVVIFFVVACKKEKQDPAPDPTPTETKDTTRPVITLKGKINDTINLGSYTDPGATATDNKDGDITPFIAITYSTATMNQNATYNFSPKGTYYIKYDVRDAAGNRAAVTRTIHVVNYADFLTGTYNAVCTCTAYPDQSSPVVTTINYTTTVTASNEYNNRFEIGILNIGGGLTVAKPNTSFIGGNQISVQGVAGVEGGSFINNNSFIIETERKDFDVNTEYHCHTVFTRQ
jgi:hypothetical protein